MTETKKLETKDTKPLSSTIRKYRMLIIIGVIISLFLINVVFLTFLPNKSNAVVQSRSEMLALQLQNQSANKVISDLKATDQEKRILDLALPTKSSLLSIIELFESLGTTAKVQSFTFESEEPRQDEKGYAFLPVTLVLEGSLQQTTAALDRLEQTPYVFTIRQTLIESPDDLGGKITIRLSLRIYVRQPFN